MRSGVVGVLVLHLLAGGVRAASRAECFVACGPTIAQCASACGVYAELDAACRRAVLKRCRREGVQACAAPTTSTVTTTTRVASTATTTTTRRPTTSTTVPAGLDCRLPRPLVIGDTASGDTSSFYDHGPGSGCMQNSESPDLVYAVTPAESGTLVLSLTSAWDGGLYVRSACDDATSELACVDQGGNDFTEVLQLNVSAGVTYYVYVDGYTSESYGSFELATTLQ